MGVYLKNEVHTHTPSPINVAANLYERNTSNPVDFENDPDVQDGKSQVQVERVGIVAPAANTPMGRDSAGRAKVATPAAPDDIATKQYVDAEISGRAPASHTQPQSSITGLVARLQAIEQRLGAAGL